MNAVQERSFRAMNTDIRLVVIAGGRDGPALLWRAAQEFVAHERTLSRFDPESELTALNGAGARWMRVSPLLFRALEAAGELRTRTGGLYDPGILPALEAAGYDRSFEQLAHPGAAMSLPNPPPTPRQGAAGLSP